VIGVARAHWRCGIGCRLLDELAAVAAARDVHRLELTVMAHNEAAIALYRGHGFIVEGRRVHALRVEDAWVDEVSMARILERP
jgi:ribosomal protein S18 acetylase RimI-like enzyme